MPVSPLNNKQIDLNVPLLKKPWSKRNSNPSSSRSYCKRNQSISRLYRLDITNRLKKEFKPVKSKRGSVAVSPTNESRL